MLPAEAVTDPGDLSAALVGPYTTTWKVPEGWGEKKAEKEALKQAAIFEKQCRDGLSVERKGFDHARAGGKASGEQAPQHPELVQRRGGKGRDGENDSGCAGNARHVNLPIRDGQQAIERLHPAAKATPPKADDYDPNYFQPEEIARIWETLENEPIKWKTMVHLFLVTGCRWIRPWSCWRNIASGIRKRSSGGAVSGKTMIICFRGRTERPCSPDMFVTGWMPSASVTVCPISTHTHSDTRMSSPRQKLFFFFQLT